MGTKISMNKHFEINQNVACLRVDCKSEAISLVGIWMKTK